MDSKRRAYTSALAIASVIIFSCIWRWLDNGLIALLLSIFYCRVFCTLSKSKGIK
nr:MAG TPA: hypothetical protein [Caudoviricetes sp.]